MFSRRGFTLIELLLVIGIIGLLSSIVIIAINPTKQLDDAKDAQRRSDVKAILDAVHQYVIDRGNLPTLPNGNQAIPTTSRQICAESASASTTCTNPPKNGVFLDSLVDLDFLVDLPIDPDGPISTQTWGTNYFIIRDATTN